jgi:thiol-disulfide isomerase/thioredoxin
MKQCIWMVLGLAIWAGVSGVVKADEPSKEPEKAGKLKNAVTLKVASWDDVKKEIAQQKGRIVVLDLWSTGCQPCVKEFPNLVKLQAAHPDEVVCISFSTDYIGDGKPEDLSPDVLKFLTKQKAHLINLLSSEADEDLYKRVGIASIPVVQVYDRNGKLARQFDNEKDEYGKDGFTYEKHVTPYVNKLVESK